MVDGLECLSLSFSTILKKGIESSDFPLLYNSFRHCRSVAAKVEDVREDERVIPLIENVGKIIWDLACNSNLKCEVTSDMFKVMRTGVQFLFNMSVSASSCVFHTVSTIASPSFLVYASPCSPVLQNTHSHSCLLAFDDLELSTAVVALLSNILHNESACADFFGNQDNSEIMHIISKQLKKEHVDKDPLFEWFMILMSRFAKSNVRLRNLWSLYTQFNDSESLLHLVELCFEIFPERMSSLGISVDCHFSNYLLEDTLSIVKYLLEGKLYFAGSHYANILHSIFLNASKLWRTAVDDNSEDLNTRMEWMAVTVDVLRISKDCANVESTSTEFPSGFRTRLMELIGILLLHSRSCQDKLRECGGIPLVLGECKVDDNNPYIREWTIVAVRYMCEDNLENQQEISKFELRECLNEEHLAAAGLEPYLDEEGRIRFRKL